MINAGKILFDIALQRITGFAKILTRLPHFFVEVFHADMSSLRQSRRIGMKNESFIENPIKIIEKYVVHDACLLYTSPSPRD